MAYYNISFETETEILTVNFGDQPGTNAEIIKEATEKIEALKPAIQGSKVLRVTGPASLPVSMMLAHQVGRIVNAVACFDPKLQKFVVSISHDPFYSVGDLVDPIVE